MNRATIPAALAALLLASLAPAVSAQAPAAPSTATIHLDHGATLEAVIEQSWEGPAAKRMREALDIYFGASDSSLTDSEVDRIARATETDMRGQPLPWLLTDGTVAVVNDILVSFEGASGRSDSLEPLKMTHRISLTAPPAAMGTVITVMPRFDAKVEVASPGFEPQADASVAGASIVSGVWTTMAKKDSTLKLTLGEPSSNTPAPEAPPVVVDDTTEPPAPDVSPPPAAPAGRSGPSPIVIIVLLVLAVVVIGLGGLAFHAMRRSKPSATR